MPIVLGAFDAGMAEQELGRAQVTGLAVDMGREGPPQGMQSVKAGIEPGLLQPGPEQPPELAFAQMGVRPPDLLPREQPRMNRFLLGGEPGAQAVARARRQPHLDRAGIARLGFLLTDLDDFAHPGRRGDIGHPQPHQIRAPEAGVEGHVEQRQIAQRAVLTQDHPDQGHLVGCQRGLFAHDAALVPGGAR